MCRGACLFLEDKLWEQACENSYYYNLGLLAASLFFATRMVLVRIEGDDIRHRSNSLLPVIEPGFLDAPLPDWYFEQSERSWRRHIDINFVSMLAATHAAAPIIARGGRGGSIINVASIEGLRAGPNVAVYAACKAAMISFTKSMALEFSGDRIRVNCIAPDHTITPGGRGNRAGPIDPTKWRVPTPEEDDRMRRVIPLLREGDDVECGDLVAYLASDMASYITGAEIPIDGGQTV
ncbi:SDR family oxidoreductase [bacterium]|nr:SDR family oxidoreductase [bacterium]